MREARNERLATLREVQDAARGAALADLLAWIGDEIRHEARAERDAAPIAVGPLVLEPAVRLARAGESAAVLSPAQAAALALLMRNAGRPVRLDTLYYAVKRVPDLESVDAGRLVATIICRLRRMLAEIGVAQAIVTVWGVGYLLRLAEPAQPSPAVCAAARDTRAVCYA